MRLINRRKPGGSYPLRLVSADAFAQQTSAAEQDAVPHKCKWQQHDCRGQQGCRHFAGAGTAAALLLR